MNGNNQWDAIVIGSGLGGLTAAAYLATNGMKTLVLEQHYVAGGNSHVFRRRAAKGKLAFEFDVGVHYLGDCEPGGMIPMVLRGVGLEDKIEFLPMDPGGFDTLIFPGLTVKVPKGWDKYRENLIAALPDDETGIHRCLDVMEAVAREFTNVSLPVAPEDLPRMMQVAPTFMQWGMRTLADLFDDCGLGQKARAVIAAESGDYAAPPSRVPVILHAVLMDHYLKAGGFYPKGGGQVIAAHLVDVLRSNGGELRTRAKVERIIVESGKVEGVIVGGEELRAPVVVSNGDLKRTFLDLVGREHISEATADRICGYRMALPLFCVYLGLDIDLSETMPNTNLFSFSSFDVEGMYQDA